MHSDKHINLNPPKRFQILKSYILKLPKFIIRNLLLIKFLKNNFLEEGNWSSDVLSNVKERLGSWKPDLIISSFSPIDSHYIASKLKSDFNCYWFAEYRDNFSYNTMAFSIRKHELLSILLRRFEKRILYNCDLIVGVTSIISKYYESYFHKDTITVYGGWDSDLTEKNIPNPFKMNSINVLHCGSMLYGSRNIDIIKNYLLKNPDSSLDYVFHLYGDDTDLFNEEVKKHNLSQKILLNKPVSFAMVNAIQEMADILLIIMKSSKMEKYTLTGKIFSYIRFGKPILIIDKYNSEASKLILKYKMGYVVSNSFELNNVLKIPLENMNRPSRQVIEEFSRVNQFKKILNRINQLSDNI